MTIFKALKWVCISIVVCVGVFLSFGLWLLNQQEDILETSLKDQDYPKIVEVINKRKNSHIKRWLNEKAEEGHVILQFELAKKIS